MHDLFERRLGLHPVNFDAEGRMRTETALGDYPQVMPNGPRGPDSGHLAGLWVKSHGRKTAASSSVPGHEPALAADENCRTWWAAADSMPGEWISMDLGESTPVRALQINFAEHAASTAAARGKGEDIIYQLHTSDNGADWRPLPGLDAEQSAAGPHHFIDLGRPHPIRHLKVRGVSMPGGGHFALRDLRIFGPPAGNAPQAVAAPAVERHADDDRNATIRWKPVPRADGCIVRFGDAPDRLWQAIQLQGGDHAKLTTHVLNRGAPYCFRVDAFNAHGLATGDVGVPAEP